jgi:hypothetical protein
MCVVACESPFAQVCKHQESKCTRNEIKLQVRSRVKLDIQGESLNGMPDDFDLAKHNCDHEVGQ